MLIALVQIATASEAATVCVARTYKFVDSANRWPVFLDGEPRLLLRNRSHHCFDVDPGTVNVGVEHPELAGYTKASLAGTTHVTTGRYVATDELALDMAAGEHAVLRVERFWADSRWGFRISRVESAWLDERRLRTAKAVDLEITPEVLRRQLGADRAAEILK